MFSGGETGGVKTNSASIHCGQGGTTCSSNEEYRVCASGSRAESEIPSTYVKVGSDAKLFDIPGRLLGFLGLRSLTPQETAKVSVDKDGEKKPDYSISGIAGVCRSDQKFIFDANGNIVSNEIYQMQQDELTKLLRLLAENKLSSDQMSYLRELTESMRGYREDYAFFGYSTDIGTEGALALYNQSMPFDQGYDERGIELTVGQMRTVAKITGMTKDDFRCASGKCPGVTGDYETEGLNATGLYLFKAVGIGREGRIQSFIEKLRASGDELDATKKSELIAHFEQLAVTQKDANFSITRVQLYAFNGINLTDAELEELKTSTSITNFDYIKEDPTSGSLPEGTHRYCFIKDYSRLKVIIEELKKSSHPKKKELIDHLDDVKKDTPRQMGIGQMILIGMSTIAGVAASVGGMIYFIKKMGRKQDEALKAQREMHQQSLDAMKGTMAEHSKIDGSDLNFERDLGKDLIAEYRTELETSWQKRLHLTAELEAARTAGNTDLVLELERQLNLARVGFENPYRDRGTLKDIFDAAHVGNKKRNNPVLLGPSDTGKSAAVEGSAQSVALEEFLKAHPEAEPYLAPGLARMPEAYRAESGTTVMWELDLQKYGEHTAVWSGKDDVVNGKIVEWCDSQASGTSQPEQPNPETEAEALKRKEAEAEALKQKIEAVNQRIVSWCEAEANKDSSREIYLFIDEAHQAGSKGEEALGQYKAGLMEKMKKLMQKYPNLHIITATTVAEFNRELSKDPAHLNRVTPVVMGFQTPDLVVDIMGGNPALQQAGITHVEPAALKAAYVLGQRTHPRPSPLNSAASFFELVVNDAKARGADSISFSDVVRVYDEKYEAKKGPHGLTAVNIEAKFTEAGRTIDGYNLTIEGEVEGIFKKHSPLGKDAMMFDVDTWFEEMMRTDSIFGAEVETYSELEKDFARRVTDRSVAYWESLSKAEKIQFIKASTVSDHTGKRVIREVNGIPAIIVDHFVTTGMEEHPSLERLDLIASGKFDEARAAKIEDGRVVTRKLSAEELRTLEADAKYQEMDARGKEQAKLQLRMILSSAELQKVHGFSTANADSVAKFTREFARRRGERIDRFNKRDHERMEREGSASGRRIDPRFML